MVAFMALLALPALQAAGPGAPDSRAPVRIGGDIRQPPLVKRVEPKFPPLAPDAGLNGTVVIEATFGPDGRPVAVQVVRGVPVLNEAAVAAVEQWRYEPLVLKGEATPFALTVTLSFHENIPFQPRRPDARAFIKLLKTSAPATRADLCRLLAADEGGRNPLTGARSYLSLFSDKDRGRLAAAIQEILATDADESVRWAADTALRKLEQ